MKLYKYNEFGNKVFESSNIDIVREICYELTDYNEFIVLFGEFRFGENVVTIHKKGQIVSHTQFYFDEVKDIVYRIKDAIGIDKIETLEIFKMGDVRNTQLDLQDLENEAIKNYEILTLSILFEK